MLRSHCSCDGILRTPERNEERIALRVDLTPTVRCERIAENPLVLRKRFAITLTPQFQQPSRALDIGEEEGDRADGEFIDGTQSSVLPLRATPSQVTGCRDLQPPSGLAGPAAQVARGASCGFELCR